MCDYLSMFWSLVLLRSCLKINSLSHFAFFATGEGEATGEGLAVGLGLVAGVVAGEAAGAGDDVTDGLFELFAGSQAAAISVTKIVGNSTARLIDVVTELLFGELLIGFASFEQD
jgi:hypothetical protein